MANQKIEDIDIIEDENDVIDQSIPKAEPEEKKPIVDFLNEDYVETLSSKKQSTEKPVDGNDKVENPTGEKQSENTENKESQPLQSNQENAASFNLDDYYDVAEFFIELIDWMGSGLLKWISRSNTTSNPYELSKTKKERLIRSLSKIMHKRNVKMSPEFQFCIILLMAYVPLTRMAIKERKDNLIKEEKLNIEQENKTKYSTIRKTEDTTEEKTKEDVEEYIIDPNDNKEGDTIDLQPKRGRPKKAAN